MGGIPNGKKSFLSDFLRINFEKTFTNRIIYGIIKKKFTKMRRKGLQTVYRYFREPPDAARRHSRDCALTLEQTAERHCRLSWFGLSPVIKEMSWAQYCANRSGTAEACAFVSWRQETRALFVAEKPIYLEESQNETGIFNSRLSRFRLEGHLFYGQGFWLFRHRTARAGE